MRILISFLFIVVLSVADIFFYRENLIPAEPSLTILPFLFILVIFERNYFNNFRFIDKNISFFLIMFVVLNLVFAVFSDSQNLLTYIGLSVISLFLYFSSFVFFMNASINQIRFVLYFALIVLGISVIYDLIFKIDYVSRGSGFAENPNGAALRFCYLVIPLLHVTKNGFVKYSLLICVLLLVFLTLSRSGFLLILLIFTVSIFGNNKVVLSKINLLQSSLKTFIFLIIFASFFFSFVGIIINYIPAFQSQTVSSRIEQFAGNKSFVSETDQGEGGRIDIMNNYVDLVIEYPFGYGTGMSSNRDFFQSATHNLYLRFFIDFGFLGFLLLISFFSRGIITGYIYKNLYYISFFLVSILGSLFTNTLMENRTFIIVLGIMNVLALKKINYENV